MKKLLKILLFHFCNPFFYLSIIYSSEIIFSFSLFITFLYSLAIAVLPKQ